LRYGGINYIKDQTYLTIGACCPSIPDCRAPGADFEYYYYYHNNTIFFLSEIATLGSEKEDTTRVINSVAA